MLQRLRVGVLAGLHEIVQVEVARDERGGLAVRLVQGQRLVPLQVAHNLLEARALAEAVGPKGLHLLLRNFARCAFDAPALGARVAQLGYLAVHGLRQPAHVVQVPLPLLRQPRLSSLASASAAAAAGRSSDTSFFWNHRSICGSLRGSMVIMVFTLGR